MHFHLLLEGHLEEPVADKILLYCNHQKGSVYGREGFGYIQKKAFQFEKLTRSGCGILVLTDFRDSRAECPPTALHEYLLKHISNPSPLFVFRFAETELESWLLADREAIANFLRISINSVPHLPDKDTRPKQTLVNLARKSRNSSVKNDIVPPQNNHGGEVGPGYMASMTTYVIDYWRPDEALKNSPSLKRCIDNLQRLK